MKKNTIKAFTLVEMLIVIVIIGILIASLMPRMQTAQGRARDVARKNDLSQIQTAIITSQADRKEWPGMTNPDANKITDANRGLLVKEIGDELKAAGMTSIPADPNGSNANYGIGSSKLVDARANDGQYLYMVAKRNGVKDAGFVLMAKTEVEGSSNWVVCSDVTNDSDKFLDKKKGYIQSTDDLAKLKLCNTVKEAGESESCGIDFDNNTCTYKKTGELRYILAY